MQNFNSFNELASHADIPTLSGMAVFNARRKATPDDIAAYKKATDSIIALRGELAAARKRVEQIADELGDYAMSEEGQAQLAELEDDVRACLETVEAATKERAHDFADVDWE